MYDGEGMDEGFLIRLVDQLLALLQEPNVHAVFDERAGSVMRKLAESDPLGRRSREAEMGAGLIARLPTFPKAPMDELVELKGDLAGSRSQHRPPWTLEE